MSLCQVRLGKHTQHTVSCITCATLGAENPGPGKLLWRGEAEETDISLGHADVGLERCLEYYRLKAGVTWPNWKIA